GAKSSHDHCRLSADAPALVDVALPFELRHLERRPILAVGGFDEISVRLDRHLLLVGTIRQGLAQHASVEATDVYWLVKIHEGNDGRRQIDVARRCTHCHAALQIGAPCEKRIADGPRTHAAVVAGGAGGPSGAGCRDIVGARYAKGVLGRTPWECENDVGAAFSMRHVDEFERKCSWL